MNNVFEDQQSPPQRPQRVHVAVVLLWMSWVITAGTLAFHFIAPENPGAVAGALIGVIGLCFQGLIFYYISKGSREARGVFIIIAVLGLPSLILLLNFIGVQSFVLVVFHAINSGLKIV